jgi:NAD(P)-dependent dehydrogenase (short-subunit alcohol dehydrogenase family)
VSSSKALGDKVAIVTGGGQGIGRAEARLLAEHGAAVVVNDRGGGDAGYRPADRVVREIEAAGGRAAANYADVADWREAEQLVQQAIDTFGGLDVLVCNAGIIRDRMIYNMTESEWDDVIRVHLKGHFAPTKFASQYWRSESRAGRERPRRVVFTTSEAGLYGHVGQSNYAAAKAGIVGLGLTVAREMERFGVTVNVISPRARTPMTESTFGEFKGVSGFDVWNAENVAPIVAFLATDDAGRISGQTFVVYGGTVSIVDAWPTTGTIDRQARWSVDELARKLTELAPGLEAPIKPFPDVEMPV